MQSFQSTTFGLWFSCTFSEVLKRIFNKVNIVFFKLNIFRRFRISGQFQPVNCVGGQYFELFVEMCCKLMKHLILGGCKKELRFSFKKIQVQSCKLYNNKYVIGSTQTANAEIFAFIAALVFKLSSCKVLFMSRKDKRNCLKVGYFLRKYQTSRVNYFKILNNWNDKFSGYFWNM